MFWMLVEWVEWFTSSLNGMKVVQPPEPLENWLNKQNYSLNSMKTGQTKHTSKVVLQARPNQPQHESLWYWKQSTLVLVGWVWLARLPCKKKKLSQIVLHSFFPQAFISTCEWSCPACTDQLLDSTCQLINLLFDLVYTGSVLKSG